MTEEVRDIAKEDLSILQAEGSAVSDTTVANVLSGQTADIIAVLHCVCPGHGNAKFLIIKRAEMSDLETAQQPLDLDHGHNCEQVEFYLVGNATLSRLETLSE